MRPELFFVWDHRGDSRTLGEQLFERKKKKVNEEVSEEDWSEEKVQRNKRNSISLKKKKMKK